MAQANEQSSLRIYRYAAFDAQQLSSKRINTLSSSTAQRRTQLSVYGKQLILSLEHNTQLTEYLPTQYHGPTLLRGSLEGKQHSWVRLTETSTGTHGLIWDGAELYVIEPSAVVRSALAVSLPAPSSETVIFKLSDTTLDLGADYCGSHPPDTAHVENGLATYQAITSELSDQTSSSAVEPTLLLELQTLADAAFRAQYSSDQAALNAIMVRLNNVDGIFSAQVGLQIQASDITIYGQDPATLSTSNSAETLLSSLGHLRNNDPVMRTYAVTHLFTGRDLDGDTLGIAYIGQVCGARYSASLSELRDRGAWIDSLVAAHELGHQLGAVHDGSGVCGGTAAQGYLMGSQITGSSELSQCSRDTIFATMQSAACLIPIGPPDIAIASSDSPLHAAPGVGVSWTLPIQNIGTSTASSLSIEVVAPLAVAIDAAGIAGGSCITTSNDIDTRVNCQVDSLSVYETRSLQLTLHSDYSGNYLVTASVQAAIDYNTSNNSAAINLSVTTVAASPVTTTSTAAATTDSTSSSGGGGAVSIAWLLMLAGLAGLRYAGMLQHRTQPLH